MPDGVREILTQRRKDTKTGRQNLVDKCPTGHKLTDMASDYSPLFTPRIIGVFLLITAAAIALVIALVRGVNAFNRYAVGWKALTQKFPATDVHKFGGRYKRQSGFFGSGSNNCVSGSFLIELAQEGFWVTANFARTPILIPWSAIRDISEMDMFGLGTYVRLTVDYEIELKFTIPKDALREIQGNVPAERFHKAVFADLLADRLNDLRTGKG